MLQPSTIYLVSGNAGKQKEFSAALTAHPALRFETRAWPLEEIQELDLLHLSRAKLEQAVIFAKQAGLDEGYLLIDDTALNLGELGGFPGPFVKWLLDSLSLEEIVALNVAKPKGKDPSALAICVLGLYQLETGQAYFFRGETAGTLVLPRGERSFGWDPIFQPLETSLTYAEMELTQKNKLSHRAKAIKNLLDFFDQQR